MIANGKGLTVKKITRIYNWKTMYKWISATFGLAVTPQDGLKAHLGAQLGRGVLPRSPKSDYTNM